MSDTSNLLSAIYRGSVFHKRFVPKVHAFNYNIFLFWLDLQELDKTLSSVKGLSTSKWSWVRFKRDDYLSEPEKPLHEVALDKMSGLAGHKLSGKVFLLGQLRIFGWYFSPVNFYYLQQPDGHFSHMLAEVSNTPWNDKHCYFVDLQNPERTQKNFHVSPFNPLDMQYIWKVNQPNENLNLSIDCKKEERHFIASLDLVKEPLTAENLRKNLLKIPHMTLKTVFGIYWEALKLFFKKVPIYDYQKN